MVTKRFIVIKALAVTFALLKCCLANSQVPSETMPWEITWRDEFGSQQSSNINWCRSDWRAYQCKLHDLEAFRTDPVFYPPDNVYFLHENNGQDSFLRQTVEWKKRSRWSIDRSDTLSPWIYHTYNYTAPAWFASLTKFKYGYFEARCRLPLLGPLENNRGIGANFWLFMSSTPNTLPSSEIDVVEFVCDYPPHTHTCNVHHKESVSNSSVEFDDLGSARLTPNDGQFHTYGAWWGPDFVKFYIDGQYYRDARNPIPSIAADMIPMQIYLDINVFTMRGLEEPNSKTKFPYNYDIDYVRVYQLNLDSCAAHFQNCSPMSAFPSVYRTITFGGTNGCQMPSGSTKSLTANTSITIQPGFEAPLGAELTMDIYPYCHSNIVQPCGSCTDCD